MKVINKDLMKKAILILTVIALCLIPVSGFSGDSPKEDALPKGAQPMITAVEGNITYYAKAGDKVAKGEPLFFVSANDFPITKIRQIKQDIVYYRKTFNRKLKLAKTHSLSVQEMDDAWQDYHSALNDLAIAEQQTKCGFYTAPFDCEIIRREVPETSGIGDGNPAMFIKEIPVSEVTKSN